jgi:ABC-type uncharacterized transport system fused permease/ATPase subunit
MLTGKKGSGKSSLIAKINGVIQDQVGAEGSIRYPAGAKIITISQDAYFPAYGTGMRARGF